MSSACVHVCMCACVHVCMFRSIYHRILPRKHRLAGSCVVCMYVCIYACMYAHTIGLTRTNTQFEKNTKTISPNVKRGKHAGERTKFHAKKDHTPCTHGVESKSPVSQNKLQSPRRQCCMKKSRRSLRRCSGEHTYIRHTNTHFENLGACTQNFLCLDLDVGCLTIQDLGEAPGNRAENQKYVTFDEQATSVVRELLRGKKSKQKTHR